VISLEEAKAHVLERVPLLPVADLDLATAVGCVTAEAVTAGDAIPSFDNTAMDGYAVRSADVADASAGAPARLDVVATLAAGTGDRPEIGPGQAARIMTGAPVPPGADAIVMVELTEVDGDGVLVQEPVPAGNHIRRVGEDVQVGDVVVREGTVLTPALIGVLANVGRETVRAHRRPRVGVLSTGDELVTAPAPLAFGQIRDSNRPMLLAEVVDSGFEAVNLGTVPDDEAVLTRAIADAASTCDAIVTSGGVSVGDFDLMKQVLDDLGDMRWMQIAIRPAKPFAFGLVDGTPVFGLPGNPVSSLVSFELFARPALRSMMGHPQPQRTRVQAVADVALARRPDGKTHFLRVVANYRDGGFHVTPVGGQGSHQLSAMASANALAVLPDGDGIGAGGTLTIIPLGEIPGPT
jgi:molybdenum cofactor synthesis domain-containing protein